MNCVGGCGSSSGEVLNLLLLEAVKDGFLLQVGEEHTNLSMKVLIEDVRVITVLLFRVASETNSHNFILSEEEFTIFTHITLEILERTGSHVLEGDDVRVLVLIKSRLNLFDETILSFSSLLLDTGEIHDLLTLTSRHFYFS